MPPHDDPHTLSDQTCLDDPDETLGGRRGSFRWLLLLALGSWAVPIVLALIVSGG